MDKRNVAKAIVSLRIQQVLVDLDKLMNHYVTKDGEVLHQTFKSKGKTYWFEPFTVMKDGTLSGQVFSLEIVEDKYGGVRFDHPAYVGKFRIAEDGKINHFGSLPSQIKDIMHEKYQALNKNQFLGF